VESVVGRIEAFKNRQFLYLVNNQKFIGFILYMVWSEALGKVA
jgi:hypothetical protein